MTALPQPDDLTDREDFEARPGDSQWNTVEAPPLGVLTQCPECGSTDITNRQ